MLRYPLAPLIVVTLMTYFSSVSFCQSSDVDKDVSVITDIVNWQHPTKEVFAKNGIRLIKVVMEKNRTYPIFYAALPGDPSLAQNAKTNREFLLALAKANGWWDFSIIASDEYKVDVRLDRKNKKLISWDFSKIEPSETTTPVENQSAKTRTMKFIDGESNVRAGPGTQYKVQFQPAKESECEVLSEKGSWFEVRFLDGKVGWAHKKNLKSSTSVENSSGESHQIEHGGSNSQPAITDKTPDSEAKSLLERWLLAQNSGDFSGYQKFYSTDFQGVKRAKGAVNKFDAPHWLDDRKEMIESKDGINVSAQNFRVEQKTDGYDVYFDQYYCSPTYSDWGPKVIKLRQAKDGLQIVYEELLESHKLKPGLPTTPAQVAVKPQESLPQISEKKPTISANDNTLVNEETAKEELLESQKPPPDLHNNAGQEVGLSEAKNISAESTISNANSVSQNQVSNPKKDLSKNVPPFDSRTAKPGQNYFFSFGNYGRCYCELGYDTEVSLSEFQEYDSDHSYICIKGIPFKDYETCSMGQKKLIIKFEGFDEGRRAMAEFVSWNAEYEADLKKEKIEIEKREKKEEREKKQAVFVGPPESYILPSVTYTPFGPKVKGFSLGMSLGEGVKVINERFPTWETEKELKKQESKIVISAHKTGRVSLLGDLENRVEVIEFYEVSEIFNAVDMSFDAFVNEFAQSYNIPNLQRNVEIGYGGSLIIYYTYSSPDGWEIKMTGIGDRCFKISLQRVPKAIERKFD